MRICRLEPQECLDATDELGCRPCQSGTQCELQGNPNSTGEGGGVLFVDLLPPLTNRVSHPKCLAECILPVAS